MSKRITNVIRYLGIIVLIFMAIGIAMCFRLSIVEKIEVTDTSVQAILEQAVDSIKIITPAKCHVALFVETTENSLTLNVGVPNVFEVSEEIKGCLKISGINIFWEDDILSSDIPAIYRATGKKSVFLILSQYGFNRYINSDLERPILKCLDSLNRYHKYIDGQWTVSTFEETVIEQHDREFERWRQEHPDTLEDSKPVITPVFAEKYDSLTDKNFNAFLYDWEQWSDKMRSMSTDSMLNAVIARVMSDYNIGDSANTCKFVSFFDDVEVRKYSGKYNEYPEALDNMGTYDDAGWEYMMKASERYRYVPSIDSCENILYVTTEIKRLLSLYVGGVCESEDDRFDDYEKWTPIRDDRLATLRQLIPVVKGHWGGHWHICSMPIIYSIHVFDDGFIVEMRTSWCTGETVFYPFDPSRPKESSGEWIE